MNRDAIRREVEDRIINHAWATVDEIIEEMTTLIIEKLESARVCEEPGCKREFFFDHHCEVHK